MTKPPTILGLNTVYHESSACLLRGCRPAAFAEQERFNRIKHAKPARIDNADEIPIEAIEYCLQQAGVRWDQLDHVAVSFDPELRSILPDEPTAAGGWGSPEGEALFLERIRTLPDRLSEHAGQDLTGRWHWVPHERAHAASAFYASPFTEAAVLAESSTALIAHGSALGIDELETVQYPHSLGFLWEKLSKFLGFGEYDAGKVMALAAFGPAGEYADHFKNLVACRNGSFEVSLDQLLFRAERYEPLELLFGPRRPADGILGAREVGVAAALQTATEEVLFNLSRRAQRETGSRNLCLAGGVMMNCVALGRLLAQGPFKEIFVQPVAHDGGTALGAALEVYHASNEGTDRWIMHDPFLGPRFTEAEMEGALRDARLSFYRSPNVEREAAESIAAGRIVGWFQGAAEAGPRALGNRSILADPRNPATKDLINLKAKHREFFRPFAPAVMAEQAPDWFEIPRDSPSLRFMSFALPVRPDKQSLVPAIVHVDGTGRLQVVDRTLNAPFHRLISEFHRLTGVPLVINTSFNTYDEPMVLSPSDAVKTFLRTDLDLLFLGDFVVNRPGHADSKNASDAVKRELG